MEQGADYPVAEAVRSSLGVWIFVVPPPDSAHIASLRREYRLDLGESEAILVAEALGNTPLLMDERRGVQCASVDSGSQTSTMSRS